jgi:hypothetical protein
MTDPVSDLEKARTELVNMRRQWASVLAGPYQRGKTEEATERLVLVQKAIEAIDAAIADERKANPGSMTRKPLFGE